MKTSERCQWYRSGVCIVKGFTHWFGATIVDFEQVHAGWVLPNRFVSLHYRKIITQDDSGINAAGDIDTSGPFQANVSFISLFSGIRLQSGSNVNPAAFHPSEDVQMSTRNF